MLLGCRNCDDLGQSMMKKWSGGGVYMSYGHYLPRGVLQRTGNQLLLPLALMILGSGLTSSQSICENEPVYHCLGVLVEVSFDF